MKEFCDKYLKSLGYKGCDDFFSSADVPQQIVFDMMKSFALSVLPKYNDNPDIHVSYRRGFNDCIYEIRDKLS